MKPVTEKQWRALAKTLGGSLLHLVPTFYAEIEYKMITSRYTEQQYHAITKALRDARRGRRA
jgi:hypothetical protein